MREGIEDETLTSSNSMVIERSAAAAAAVVTCLAAADVRVCVLHEFVYESE